MIVKIQVRDDNGKYSNATAREFSDAALSHISNYSMDGWGWMKDQLCRFCILRAEKYSNNPVVADKWYARYQALRGIA